MRKFLGEIGRFRRDSSGNVAVIFLIALVPLLSFMGAAIDYSRASSARTAMQAALDSASLMIAKDLSSGALKPADVSTKGLAYFTAMYVHKDAKNVKANATYTQASGQNGSTVVLSASADIKTEFMQIVGFPTMGFNTSSTSTWGNSLLRVALVLDNTGSMAGTKLSELKDASEKLVNKLGALAKTSGDVLISVVPFASAVNVGKDKKDATWLRWDLWDPKNENSSGDSYCSTGSWYTMAMCKGHGYSWNHTVGSPATTQWNGCVSDRDQSNDVSSAAPTSLATKFVADQDTYCPTKLLPLTESDKQTIKDTIKAMTAQGGTNQTVGLQWGWLSLLQQAPLNAPAEDPNNVYQKVIILFSDGQNTVNRWDGNGTMGTSAAERKKIDDRMTLLCAEAKKTATIYTVQLDDGTGVSPVLPTCASGAQNFFMLTDPSEIDGAFSQISTSISKLRVSQ
jgi:Flp pilus assembly protein TadG